MFPKECSSIIYADVSVILYKYRLSLYYHALEQCPVTKQNEAQSRLVQDLKNKHANHAIAFTLSST